MTNAGKRIGPRINGKYVKPDGGVRALAESLRPALLPKDILAGAGGLAVAGTQHVETPVEPLPVPAPPAEQR